MRRTLWLVLLVTAMAPSHGALSSIAKQATTVFRAGQYARPASLATLSLRDLSFARNKLDNIDGLLDLATAENRVDDIVARQIRSGYLKSTNGDVLLLTCLRNVACQPNQFLKTAQTSTLHAEVIRRNPGLTFGQVNQKVGAVTERLMNRHFEESGWTRLDGQVGPTGIDGLFIKRRNGAIREVMVAESKYNTSSLGETNHGAQMSKDWIRRKLVELQTAYPDDPTYREIDRFIEKDVYRALVWNLKVDDEAIYIALSKVKSKGSEARVLKLYGEDVEEWAKPLTKRIRLKEPENAFQRSFVQRYLEELDAIGKAQF